jgi:hypothetical protein
MPTSPAAPMILSRLASVLTATRSPDLLTIDRVLIALGAVFLGFTLQISDGFYRPHTYPMFCLAIGCVAGGVLRTGSALIASCPDRLIAAILAAGLLANFVMLLISPPGYYLKDRSPFHHPGYIAGIVAAAVLTALIVVDHRRWRQLWFPALLVVYAGLGVWLIRASPAPYIDVMSVQRAAIDALAQGRSPYSITFPNIYGGELFYAADTVKNSRVGFGLPYPPVSLLMAAPGQLLLGDVRYTQLLAVVAGCAAIGYSAHNRVAPLSAALVLFTPRTFFVLEQGWTESFAICWLGITVAAAARQLRGLALTLGLLCAVKQHMVIALAFGSWLSGVPAHRAERNHLALRAAAVAALVTLPFILWDPAGFWKSVVWLQFQEPLRADSLSMISLLVHAGWRVPRAAQTIAPMVGLAIGLGLSFRSAPRSPAGFALAIGFSFLLMFAFSKKAFCNYYFFVLAALAASLAVGHEPGGRELRRVGS